MVMLPPPPCSQVGALEIAGHAGDGLHRIIDQVHQDLPDLLGGCNKRRVLRPRLQVRGNHVFLEQTSDQRHGVLDDLVHIGQLHFLLAGAVQVNQVSDRVADAVESALDQLQLALQVFIAAVGRAQDIQQGRDPLQGRVDFVGDGGGQLPGGGQPFGADQLILHLLGLGDVPRHAQKTGLAQIHHGPAADFKRDRAAVLGLEVEFKAGLLLPGDLLQHSAGEGGLLGLRPAG